MNTPERNQIGSTSISKIEDSPVFNYINGLSPIKPVKSTHITQSFNPLSFAALPSIFTSPHVSSNKESRILQRYNNYSDKANEGDELHNNSTERPENLDSGASMSVSSINPPSGHAKSNEELQGLNCSSGSPDSNANSLMQVDHLLNYGDTPDFTFSRSKKHPENGSSEHSKEGMGYDWEGLITNGADMLIFVSPDESETMRLIQKPLELLGDFSPIIALQNDSNNMQIVQIMDSVASCEQHETEEPSSHHVRACELDEHQGLDFVNYSNSEKCMTHYAVENLDSGEATDSQIYCEPTSNLHRGLRRRCLDFETVGSLKKNLGEGSSCSSMMSRNDNDNHAPDDKQLLRSKSVGSSSHILNGIGLHLNALTTSSKRYQDVNSENLLYGRQLSLPSSTALYPSSTAEHELLVGSVVSEREGDRSETEVRMDEDGSHPSPYARDEDLNPNSPKKKRRKEQAGESEMCKRCNCKKSKCLKLYCECFAAGVYCMDSCSCQECFNKLIHEDKVLATRKQIETRNPLAFAPKVIRNSDSVPEHRDESSKTPASARHKRGCNCKKSSCLKKYCECYQGGVGCSVSCRCEGCKNAFGRKDGSVSVELETEHEEEEMEAGGKSVVKKPSIPGTEIQNNVELNPGSLLPTTPLKPCRPMVPLAFSSKTKMGSSFLIPGSSSGLYTGQKVVGKLNILRPQPKNNREMEIVSEDEMPEILRVDSSPSTVVKAGSPNSKRISPPQSEFRSSDLPRTGRKLILQAIPSFPSLTPQR